MKRDNVPPRVDPPLKWHGGKHYLAQQLVAMMLLHKHYVEPFFGGGSVLFAKNPIGVSEVVNDIYGELTVFWRVLQNPEQFDQFVRIINAMPFSEFEWQEAKHPRPDETNVDIAVRFFVRCRMSRAGKFDDFATMSRKRVRREMNEQVSAWLSCVEGLPAVHARLKRVVILNQPALEIIRTQDGPETQFYLDPPYLHETRASTADYAYEMTQADHEALLAAILKVKGKVMLSGYHSELYDRVLRGWHLREFDLPNNAAAGDAKRRMIECVWMNFVPVEVKE